MKFALIAILICMFTPILHAKDSPPEREARALNAFFAELHPGMTEAAFNRLLQRYQFKDGVIFIPVLCSIHDPSSHFHIPDHGVYAFDFNRERRLSSWHRWTQNSPNSFS